ncbi:MAG: hypothetical protein ISQ70_08915, partial [Pirellulales bacterium]|nr:hypothetical protein [Pirellulales bacterium]
RLSRRCGRRVVHHPAGSASPQADKGRGRGRQRGQSWGIFRDASRPARRARPAIDGREEIITDVTAAPANLRAAIADLLEGLLALSDAEDVIAAQLLPDAKSQDRLPLVLDRIGQLIAAGRN